MSSSHRICSVTCLRFSARWIAAQSGSARRRWPYFLPAAVKSRASNIVSVSSADNGQASPAAASRFKVSRTVGEATPTRRAISLPETPAALPKHVAHVAHRDPLCWHRPLLRQKPSERTLSGPAEAPLNRASSSRNNGRNHLGMGSDFIPQSRATSVGISRWRPAITVDRPLWRGGWQTNN